MFLASFFHKFYAENFFFLFLNVCYKTKILLSTGSELVVLVCFVVFFNLSFLSMVIALFSAGSGPLIRK